MLSRRDVLAGVTAATATVLAPKAYASTVVGLTLPELVNRSSRVALCRVAFSESQWATVAGARRIVTISRLVEEEALSSGSTLGEHLVVTLGGRIGDLGQRVHGEAVLNPDEPAVVFLGPDRLSPEMGPHRRVVGMAQGSFELDAPGARARLRPSRNLPELVRRSGLSRPLAVEELQGKSLQECADLVRGLGR